MTGDITMLWATLVDSGWLELLAIRMVTLTDVGLPTDSNDREIRRFAQRHQMVILTDNHRQSGIDSLGETIAQENTSSSLPVITVGNRQRLIYRAYRENSISRWVEIIIDLDSYLGAGRIFIP